MMLTEEQRFIKSLREYPLTSNQRRTLRGQALSGDMDGARSGLRKILRRTRHAKQ